MHWIKHLLTILTCLTLPLTTCHAGGPLDSLGIRIRTSYNMGATSPLPLPASIRSIDAFHPTASLAVGADVTCHLGERFGLTAGVRFENKGMNAEVTVKSYPMEMTKGSSQLNGLFTGHVKQKVTQWMLTMPLQASFSLSQSVSVKGGPYFSLLVSKSFSGIAFDGYLRQGNPTGPKIEIGNTEGEWATYDFSDNIRSLQWGISVGLDWLITHHIGFSADLFWGLSGLFQSDFKTVEQTLYPIYGSIGVSYQLFGS